jgi:hypothetical protein
LTLEAPKKVRAQSIVELFHEIFSQFLVVFFELLKISPFIWVQEVHEIEQFPDVVVQWRLRA